LITIVHGFLSKLQHSEQTVLALGLLIDRREPREWQERQRLRRAHENHSKLRHSGLGVLECFWDVSLFSRWYC